jgi:hypothetical protein
VDIERVMSVTNQPVIKKTLLLFVELSKIRPAFTTTVYAFLNPKLPSAAWDFFCLRFGFAASFFLSISRNCLAIARRQIPAFSTTTDWPIFNSLR